MATGGRRGDTIQCEFCLDEYDESQIAGSVIPCEHAHCFSCLQLEFDAFETLRCPKRGCG